MRARQEHQHGQLHFRRIQLTTALKCSRETDKPTVGAKTFRRIRRAGLAENRQRQLVELRTASRAVANRTSHPIRNDCSMRRGNVDATALDGREILGGSDLWLIKMPAINERCVSSQQLNWRGLNMIALADPFTRGTIGLFRHVIALGEERLLSIFPR